jgi:hypothetical protein
MDNLEDAVNKKIEEIAERFSDISLRYPCHYEDLPKVIKKSLTKIAEHLPNEIDNSISLLEKYAGCNVENIICSLFGLAAPDTVSNQKLFSQILGLMQSDSAVNAVKRYDIVKNQCFASHSLTQMAKYGSDIFERVVAVTEKYSDKAALDILSDISSMADNRSTIVKRTGENTHNINKAIELLEQCENEGQAVKMAKGLHYAMGRADKFNLIIETLEKYDAEDRADIAKYIGEISCLTRIRDERGVVGYLGSEKPELMKKVVNLIEDYEGAFAVRMANRLHHLAINNNEQENAENLEQYVSQLCEK